MWILQSHTRTICSKQQIKNKYLVSYLQQWWYTNMSGKGLKQCTKWLSEEDHAIWKCKYFPQH